MFRSYLIGFVIIALAIGVVVWFGGKMQRIADNSRRIDAERPVDRSLSRSLRWEDDKENGVRCYTFSRYGDDTISCVKVK